MSDVHPIRHVTSVAGSNEPPVAFPEPLPPANIVPPAVVDTNAAPGAGAGVGAAEPSSSYQLDDFKVEYHPNSGRATEVHHFEEFTRDHSSSAVPPLDPYPYQPFGSLAEFEFAELANEAGLSKKHVNAFLKLIQCIKSSGEEFSFATHTDIQKAWTAAATKVTPVRIY